MSDRSERDEKPEAASRHEFGKSTRRTFISRWPDRRRDAITGSAVRARFTSMAGV